MHTITLTTDFGCRDWFVGAMKGVILRIAPRARIVDLTHEIPAGDVRAGAFGLAAAHRFFPKGTVHVAVVDPGVGSHRPAIAVETADALFVGPDNGVLSLALAPAKIQSVRRLENERYFLQPVSRTFHGRDIFAPVAAHLSRGVPMSRLGPAQKDFIRLRWPGPRRTKKGIEGEIVYIDRFGNAISNIEHGCLEARRCYEAVAGRKRLGPVRPFYQSVAAGQCVAVPGSSGLIEVSINGGSAARTLGLKIGTPLEVRRAD